MLAGVSTDYYVRLEQGRERNPSDQVIEALARVFCLDTDATVYLHELVHPREGGRTFTDRDDHVDPNVVRLMEQWTAAVAFVVNHRLDILAGNRLGTALWDGYEHSPNLLRFAFLNPESREFYLEWEEDAVSMVAHLRAMTVGVRNDPLLSGLIEELSSNSADFRRLWARHDVLVKKQERKHLHHRVVGDLHLWHETFAIGNAPGQLLFVAQAEPGSPSESALGALAMNVGNSEARPAPRC
ncbi:transcriptional regulator [Planotetraspora thailandica]|uniref:Transcriptional regulator n=2 Tax=Planotetraspora thailandica TaxID=487172 RepID=A0A8J3UYS6_9ACTN|nr:transcriptional regulator [Planotetraspora thailandica]